MKLESEAGQSEGDTSLHEPTVRLSRNNRPKHSLANVAGPTWPSRPGRRQWRFFGPRSAFSARHATCWTLAHNQRMEVQMAETHLPATPTAGLSPASSVPASGASSSAGSFQRDKSSTAKSNGTDGERANGAGALSELKDKIAGAQEVVKTKYRVVSESTDDYVHDSPWKAVAMALAGGLIIGMLAAR
jgi:ElaB protein